MNWVVPTVLAVALLLFPSWADRPLKRRRAPGASSFERAGTTSTALPASTQSSPTVEATSTQGASPVPTRAALSVRPLNPSQAPAPLSPSAGACDTLFNDWYSTHPKRPGRRYRDHMRELFTAGYQGAHIPNPMQLGDAGVAFRAGQKARKENP